VNEFLLHTLQMFLKDLESVAMLFNFDVELMDELHFFFDLSSVALQSG
jgi:hypothetical protein